MREESMSASLLILIILASQADNLHSVGRVLWVIVAEVYSTIKLDITSSGIVHLSTLSVFALLFLMSSILINLVAISKFFTNLIFRCNASLC